MIESIGVEKQQILQINEALQSVKQQTSGLSIDDCRKVSVKEVRNAVIMVMDEAKARVEGFAR